MRAHAFSLIIAFILPTALWAGHASGQESTSPASTGAPALGCCSCDYLSTKTFPGNEDFQCSFDYPAHWEMRYDPWENAVEVRAPRCETRCPGSGEMVFSVSKGKDNNAGVQEEYMQQHSPIVDKASCGGRELTVYRPQFMEPNGVSGSNVFHVGNNDGKAYDARVAYTCPQAGDWQKLERLFIDSLE